MTTKNTAAGGWPSEVTRRDGGSNLWLEFPPRRRNRRWWVRLGGSLLFATFFAFAGAAAFFKSLMLLLQQEPTAATFAESAVFGLMGLLYCLPLTFTLSQFLGRALLGWQNGRIVTGCRLAGVSWTRRAPRGIPLALHVGIDSEPGHCSGLAGTAAEEAAVLVADYGDDRHRTLVSGYPRAWLVSVARELAHRHGPRAKVRVIDDFAPVRPMQLPERPAVDRIVVTEGPGRCELRVQRQSVQLFLLGALLFESLYLAILFLVWNSASEHGVVFNIVCALLACAGVALPVAMLHARLRTAHLRVDDDGLSIETRGPLGRSRHHWRRDEVSTVEPSRGAMDTNVGTASQLQVSLRDGRRVDVLRHHNGYELLRLAGYLRRALGID